MQHALAFSKHKQKQEAPSQPLAHQQHLITHITMIYTSRYNSHILGTAISISLYLPKNFKGQHLHILAPTPEVLNTYALDLNWERYVAGYRENVISRLPQIKAWLKTLASEENVTLLCYEKGEYCHRHLVQKLIEKHHPELWGRRLDELSASEFKKLKQERQQSELAHKRDRQQDTLHKLEEVATAESQSLINPYSDKIVSELWTRVEPSKDLDLLLATIRQNWGNNYKVYDLTQDLTLFEKNQITSKLTDVEKEAFEQIFWG